MSWAIRVVALIGAPIGMLLSSFGLTRYYLLHTDHDRADVRMESDRRLKETLEKCH